jgi:hypothetical protein
MTDSASGPLPYQVSYSDHVRADLVRLAEAAKASGWFSQFLSALKEIENRLQIYPQFGQPLSNLKLEPAQLWIGVVPPLVVKYTIDEERRVVMVVSPLLPLPNSGH